MKREGNHGSYKEVSQGGHWEKNIRSTDTADTKYSKYGMDNEKELTESVDDLSRYVKKNRMKY